MSTQPEDKVSSSRIEHDKGVSCASEALFTALEQWMRSSKLHPDEIAAELSWHFCGLWNRAEKLNENQPKVKGLKPTKE
jgi:hypothetical protein